MKKFFKGIFIGVGGVAPGLSGSVLLIIFGLYEKTIMAIGTIFKDFKENIKFLFPLFSGIGLGILLFSRVVKYLLNNYELHTRYALLGLVLGTIPIFYQETKKNLIHKKYFYISALVFISSLVILNKTFFSINNPNLYQSIIMGFIVSTSMIVPGVDSGAILSGLGMYDIYITSLANLNFSILIPTSLGLIIGIFLISYLINKLLKNHHALTMAIIFGLFLSIIPNIILNCPKLSFNIESLIAILLLIIGYFTSYFFVYNENAFKRAKH